jgi:formate C-acetyltransferase
MDTHFGSGFNDTPRVLELRNRVRSAMQQPAVRWECPARIDEQHMSGPLAMRKARAVALKLAHMPTDLWKGQLFAGSMTLESPRLHAEWAFPDYTTASERAEAARKRLGIHSVFGHIVPDYPTLLSRGLRWVRADARAQLMHAGAPAEAAFLNSVIIAVEAVMDYAGRLAERCAEKADAQSDPTRAGELRQMASNLRQVPAGPAQTFWQALQSVWLLHMIYHVTMNGNAVGRLDQYAWPYLDADLEAGRLNLESAAELVDCFFLKFNERAQTTDELRAEARQSESERPARPRHYTSSQLGSDRDRLDATNHWLQNIVAGGVTPDGDDGTNPLTFLLLDSYDRNQMTNPLISVRLHTHSPQELVERTCQALKRGGGMPAIFNDEAIIPALERLGIPTPDARDYTNDGCWEVILPGRTDFVFQRLSLMLCLEWALNRGRGLYNSRQGGNLEGDVLTGVDTGDPRTFSSYQEVWEAFLTQVNAMVGGVVAHVMETVDDRSKIAPVPLLSALIDGAIASRRDLTAGGAKYRTFGLLAESAAHAIDSLVAIETVIFEQQQATMADLCDALDADFRGWGPLRTKLLAAPKYGNDDERADRTGQQVIRAFVNTAAKHAEAHRASVRFPVGVATFSWYIGIGEGLGASPDGRRASEPVSSNFSPALGRDKEGIPAAILSHAKMMHCDLPAGGPLDLRLARRLVGGEEGTKRMAGLVRGFVESGGSIMTLTIVDTEELRAAQREPENYSSLRVRMGGWCAYFTMLSREQQEHHIRRQETRS